MNSPSQNREQVLQAFKEKFGATSDQQAKLIRNFSPIRGSYSSLAFSLAKGTQLLPSDILQFLSTQPI